jgi:NitT/TauT family transport system permease protein
MDLVMTSVVVLALCAATMHVIILLIERAIRKRFGIV